MSWLVSNGGIMPNTDLRHIVKPDVLVAMISQSAHHGRVWRVLHNVIADLVCFRGGLSLTSHKRCGQCKAPEIVLHPDCTPRGSQKLRPRYQKQLFGNVVRFIDDWTKAVNQSRILATDFGTFDPCIMASSLLCTSRLVQACKTEE